MKAIEHCFLLFLSLLVFELASVVILTPTLSRANVAESATRERIK